LTLRRGTGIDNWHKWIIVDERERSGMRDLIAALAVLIEDGHLERWRDEFVAQDSWDAGEQEVYDSLVGAWESYKTWLDDQVANGRTR
jgi:hypothetical protein